MIITILAACGLIAAFFALMSVRLIFLKKGEFKGTCASQSPFLNKEGVTCNVCGRTPDQCENNDDDSTGTLAPMPAMGEVERVMALYGKK